MADSRPGMGPGTPYKSGPQKRAEQLSRDTAYMTRLNKRNQERKEYLRSTSIKSGNES